MSKEKRIEEMAKITCQMYCRDKEKKCAGVQECDMQCLHYQRCEALYNAGYRKQSEWISVDEKLPEDGVWVLGYSAKSGRGGLCNCLKSYVREFGNYDDTTHWLPLPEFPKNKGE